MDSETEQSNELDHVDLSEGLEYASEEVFYRYTVLLEELDSANDEPFQLTSELRELENALVSLRVLQQLVQRDELSADLLQTISREIKTDVKDVETIQDTVDSVQETF
jgi:hypothetical protein